MKFSLEAYKNLKLFVGKTVSCIVLLVVKTWPMPFLIQQIHFTEKHMNKEFLEQYLEYLKETIEKIFRTLTFCVGVSLMSNVSS